MASLVTHPADVVKTHMQVSMPRILTNSSECTKIQVGFAKNCGARNINFGHLMKLCTQVSDSKTRLSRAVVETVTNRGIKGFMAGLAPR